MRTVPPPAVAVVSSEVAQEETHGKPWVEGRTPMENTCSDSVRVNTAGAIPRRACQGMGQVRAGFGVVRGDRWVARPPPVWKPRSPVGAAGAAGELAGAARGLV